MITVDLLKRIEKSHLIPMEIQNNRDLQNNNRCTKIQADLSEWQHLSGDQLAERDIPNSNKVDSNLQILEDTILHPRLQFDILPHLIINDTI